MRILLLSHYGYPSYKRHSSGRNPMAWPSGSGGHVHDLTAKGLGELGHEVLYLLEGDIREPLPPGVKLVREPVMDVDVCHGMTSMNERGKTLVRQYETLGIPWVATCHLDLTARGLPRAQIADQWIFVSRTMAHSMGSERFVTNGIDPKNFIYRQEKDDFFLFITNMDWADSKGLPIALDLVRETGVRLVVAGSAKTKDVIEKIARDCAAVGAEYIGDIRGEEKAEWLANARAVLFPSQMNEAFGLVIAEALMSGTPVITSDQGACPELVSPDVGFVCNNRADYLNAVEKIGTIFPQACRQRAMEKYHYRRMAADYVVEYEKEKSRMTIRV